MNILLKAKSLCLVRQKGCDVAARVQQRASKIEAMELEQRRETIPIYMIAIYRADDIFIFHQMTRKKVTVFLRDYLINYRKIRDQMEGQNKMLCKPLDFSDSLWYPLSLQGKC